MDHIQNRRQFLYTTGLTGLTLLAGCAGGSASPTAPAPAGPEAAAARPAAGAAPPPAPTWEPVKLTVPYTPISSSNVPFWIAVDDGLFAREGIEVEPQFVNGTPPILQAMASGQYPFGIVGGGDVLLNRLGGGDAVLIGNHGGIITIECYARPEIRSVADLRGKAIAVTRMATSTYFAGVLVLGSAGIKPDEVVWVQSGGNSESAAVMLAGQADAAMIGYPTTLQLAQSGFSLLASPSKLGENGLFPNNSITVRTAWLQEPRNRELALRFMRAFNAGLQAERTDDEAMRRVLRKYTQLEDEATLQATMAFARENMPSSLQVDERSIVNALRLLDHPDAATADPKQFYDNSLADEIERRPS